MSETTTLPRLLTVHEAATYLGCSADHLYRLTSQGRITYRKPGKQLRFTEADLVAYLDATMTPGHGVSPTPLVVVPSRGGRPRKSVS